MAEKKRWKSTGKTRVKKSRLGKVKKDTRKIQNGERRRGPNGKMNVYHNGRWYAAEKVKAKSNYGKKSNTSATVSSAKSEKPRKRGDRSATSATVQSALKTEKPRSVASVKGYVDNYTSARRKTRADIQNATRPVRVGAKDAMTTARAKAILASKTASSSLKTAARKFIEGR